MTAHRINISSMYFDTLDRYLWYLTCACEQDLVTTPMPYKRTDGSWAELWGRSSWDAALAIGLVHLRQECKHER